MATPSARPPHHGVSFAPPLHTHPSGPTDPALVKLPQPFVIAVLGASRGIGAHIALAYAKAGASGFVISARNEDALVETAKQIVTIRPEAKIVCQVCDVSKAEDVQALAEATKTAFGSLDVCVVSAGIAEPLITDAETERRRWPRGVVEGEIESFRDVMDVNLMGLVHASKYLMPLLLETEGGAKAFIGLNSAASHFADSSYVPISYSLSKFAANRLIEQIHEAYKEQGVCAYSLHPGGVATGGMGSGVPDSFNMANLTDDVGLCGAVCVWLTKEKRQWLSGRWISSKWDVETLLDMKEEIVREDKLKFRMNV